MTTHNLDCNFRLTCTCREGKFGPFYRLTATRLTDGMTKTERFPIPPDGPFTLTYNLVAYILGGPLRDGYRIADFAAWWNDLEIGLFALAWTCENKLDGAHARVAEMARELFSTLQGE